MTAEYPPPDRSNFVPNFQKSEENDVLDIGWTNGVLSDGRPYRYEGWCQDQASFATIFVSRIGLEDLDDDGAAAMLEREGLFTFPFPKKYVSVKSFRDPSGRDMLSINVVIGDEDNMYARGGPGLKPYPKG